MEGGPSHIDLFDPKPELTKRAGQPLPPSFGKVFTAMGVGGNNLLASRRTFAQHGESGTWVSDWYPNVAEVVDDIALVRSCWADGVNHVGSVCQMNTGSILAGRPSLGAWVTYGLGTENQDLPAFVVMNDAGDPLGGPEELGERLAPGHLPGDPVPQGRHADPPPRPARVGLRRPAEGQARPDRRPRPAPRRRPGRRLPAGRPDRLLRAGLPDAGPAPPRPSTSPASPPRPRPSTASTTPDARTSAPCASGPAGWSSAGSGSSSSIAARAASGTPTATSRATTPGSAPGATGRSPRLIKDLKRRGLLDDTLVVWGGEFGRTPMSEGTDGRDHNPYGFSMFLAGGGIKPGITVGATDEFGLKAVEDKVHVHDLHATILHLLGLDHKRLTFFRDGRDERLTVNGGKVVRESWPDRPGDLACRRRFPGPATNPLPEARCRSSRARSTGQDQASDGVGSSGGLGRRAASRPSPWSSRCLGPAARDGRGADPAGRPMGGRVADGLGWPTPAGSPGDPAGEPARRGRAGRPSSAARRASRGPGGLARVDRQGVRARRRPGGSRRPGRRAASTVLIQVRPEASGRLLAVVRERSRDRGVGDRVRQVVLAPAPADERPVVDGPARPQARPAVVPVRAGGRDASKARLSGVFVARADGTEARPVALPDGFAEAAAPGLVARRPVDRLRRRSTPPAATP